MMRRVVLTGMIASLTGCSTPGPEPARALCCARLPQTFRLYFPAGGADPNASPGSRKALREAIAYAMKVDDSTIRVIGHADGMTAPEARPDLALRRARAVAAALVAAGIARDRMTIEDNSLFLPIPNRVPGVIEPQNRLVSIEFHGESTFRG